MCGRYAYNFVGRPRLVVIRDIAMPITKVTVVGAGHVGVPFAVTIANKCPSVRVTVCDDDQRKIASWKSTLLHR